MIVTSVGSRSMRVGARVAGQSEVYVLGNMETAYIDVG